MTIEAILDELESLLIDAARVPFTNKRIIEEDDVVRLLDDLRGQLPSSITEAGQIVADRQQILEKAQEEGQKIVDKAKSYALQLTDEHVIAKQAQEHCNEIVMLANKEASSLQSDAVVYADNVFKHLEEQIARTLEVVRQGHSELNSTRKN